MAKFRSLLETLASTRTRLSTPQEILAAIAEYESEAEILNADFNHIKEQAGYRFRDAFKGLRDYMLSSYTGDRPQWWEDLYWAFPTSYTSFTKFKKALKAVQDAKITNMAEQELALWEPIADGLKALKDKAVKAVTKREERKAAEANILKGKKQQSAVMIELLESHRSEFLKRAEAQARNYLDNAIKALAKKDWNLDALIPTGRRATDDEEKRKNFFRKITEAADPYRSHKQPEIRKRSVKSEKRFIDAEVAAAELDYNGFINKMIEKIGRPVIAAELKGSIWTSARLTVTTVDGEEQVWETKIILNVSKFGNLFNQFPTRRKK